jgi:O-antigen/teichoic acid export membrane protein
MISLKHKTISGIKWTLAASIVQRIISFGTTVVLARILSPADFGLFALAFVMIDGFGIFKSLGFDSALVRRKDVDIERACNTAFFLIPAMGMILFVILFFFAPIGAKFLNNPQVTNVIRVLAVIFVFSCFAKVPQTLLYRDMKFKFKTLAELGGTIIFSVIALILAFRGVGVWSLVIGYILRIFVQSASEWLYSGWKPKFEFDKKIAWEMFHFGKYILASSIIGFLYGNLDKIVIAKVLNVTMLGYYAIAMNLSSFLSEYFLSKVGMVLYPAYSKIQESADDVKHVMLKGLSYISIIAMPFCFGLFLFAPDVLRLVFGEKWMPATNILRVLAFVGLIRALGGAIWPIFMARGKSKADFQVTLVQSILFFALVVPLGIEYGLLGVGFAMLFSSLVSFLVGIGRIRKILNLSVIKIIDSLKIALLSSFVMLIVVLFLKLSDFIKISNKNLISLIYMGIAFLIYFLVIYLMNKSILRNFKELFSYQG